MENDKNEAQDTLVRQALETVRAFASLARIRKAFVALHAAQYHLEENGWLDDAVRRYLLEAEDLGAEPGLGQALEEARTEIQVVEDEYRRRLTVVMYDTLWEAIRLRRQALREKEVVLKKAAEDLLSAHE